MGRGLFVCLLEGKCETASDGKPPAAGSRWATNSQQWEGILRCNGSYWPPPRGSAMAKGAPKFDPLSPCLCNKP